MAILAAFPSIPLLSSGSTIPNNNFLSIPRWIKRPQTLPFLQRFLPSKTLRCSSENHRPREKLEERLFSNLNQTSLKREPGSVISGIFLVAGTSIHTHTWRVGAGILAIPAVTQESGFLASTIACILCWIYMVVSGLLIAEVNVNTMCELGSGGVSLVTMARRTLGNVGVQVVCWSYIFIHYALLVANVSRSSNILTSFLNIPLWESAALFSLVFGSICYFGRVWLVGISIRNIFLEQILKQFHQVYQ